MKCSYRDCTVHTVGEVRACVFCQDGPAQQIPAELADGAPLEDAIKAKEGLGNRFKPGGEARQAADPPAQAQQEPARAPAKKKKP